MVASISKQVSDALTSDLLKLEDLPTLHTSLGTRKELRMVGHVLSCKPQTTPVPIALCPPASLSYMALWACALSPRPSRGPGTLSQLVASEACGPDLARAPTSWVRQLCFPTQPGPVDPPPPCMYTHAHTQMTERGLWPSEGLAEPAGSRGLSGGASFNSSGWGTPPC